MKPMHRPAEKENKMLLPRVRLPLSAISGWYGSGRRMISRSFAFRPESAHG